MRKLSMRERVLLGILAIVAVIGGYVLLFSRPMSQKTADLEARITQGEALTAQLEEQLTQQRQMEEAVKQLAEQEDAPPVMPAYDNLQAVMVELNAILADCQEYSISFQVDQSDNHIVRRQVTIPFICSGYGTAREVLQKLHDSSLRGLLEGVQFAQQENGTVRLTVNMSFFEYRVSQEE